MVFPVRDAVLWKRDQRLVPAAPGDKRWSGENAPRGTVISYFLKENGGSVTITISDVVSGQPFRVQTAPASAGLNRWQWDLCSTAPPPPPPGGGRGGGGLGNPNACPEGARTAPMGTYRVTLNVGGKDVGSQVVKVVEDIWLNER